MMMRLDPPYLIGHGNFRSFSARPLVTTVNYGKTADLIEMPFGVVSGVHYVLNGGPDLPTEMGNLLRAWEWGSTI